MTTVGNFAKILNTNMCDSFNISNFSSWTYPAIGKVQFNPESYTMLNSVIKNAYNLRPFPNSSNIVFNSFFNYKKLKHHAVVFGNFNNDPTDKYGVKERFFNAYHPVWAEWLSPDELQSILGNNLDLKSMAVRGAIRLTSVTLSAGLIKVVKYLNEQKKQESNVKAKQTVDDGKTEEKQAPEREEHSVDAFYETSTGEFIPIRVIKSQRDPRYYITPADPDRVEHVVASPSVSVLVSDHFPNAIEFVKEPRSDISMASGVVLDQWNKIRANESGSIFVGHDFQRYIKYDQKLNAKDFESPLLDTIELTISNL